MIGWARKWLDRRRVRKRLAKLNLSDSRRLKPIVVPEFCPICGRKRHGPVHPINEITPFGVRVLLVCNTCKTLGFLESSVTAAAERSAAAP